MSDSAALIAECDASVLAQWRERGLDYAADVVEAYQAENERLRTKMAEYDRYVAEFTRHA